VIEVIIDRTEADALNRTPKGFYNATDLNRVGQNLQYLADVLRGYGYNVFVNPKTDWTITDTPSASDMERYLLDLNALKTAFYGTTPLPDSMNGLTYEDANNIERLLLEIERNISNMIPAFRHSGTFCSGQGGLIL